MEVAEFGHAVFKIEKKGIITPVNCFGIIKSIEKKFILFADNDDFLYLIEKVNFTFEPEIFVNKLKV